MLSIQLNSNQVQISRNYKNRAGKKGTSHNKEKFILSFSFNLRVQGQMAQRLNVALCSIPSGSRDLVEFIFFCSVGFTAGSLGLI